MAVIPTTVKLAFVLLAIGFLFFIIGFASPYWYYREFEAKGWSNEVSVGEEHEGLWTRCVDYTLYSSVTDYRRQYRGRRVDQCNSLLDTSLSDEVRASQFFVTVGFICILVSAVLLILCMCIDPCKEKRILPILSAVTCLGAAACIILGCIIYGATDYFKDHLSWAFALTIVGGILIGVTGVLIIIGAILKK